MNCNVEVVRSENWTPEDRIWIENIEGAPKRHDFGKCYREKIQKEKEGKIAYLKKISNTDRPNDRWAWLPHDEYKDRWGAPEWVIKHYQSLTNFGKCVFPECFCKVIEAWKISSQQSKQE